MSEETEALPIFLVDSPVFDPSNQDHVNRWIWAGRPNLEEVDADGKSWRPWVEHKLKNDGTYQIVLAPAPLVDNPLTDVEIAIRGAAENFEKARLAAPKALDRLKGTIHTALVSGGMSSGEATAAGVGLVLLHGPLLAAFEAAGGHPVAGAALYAAIASPESVAALPWLTAPILAIFAAALAPGK